ncbi:uncharacterized protein LOC132197849 [Neocloeon triangulifer]|uniref:uncharacterized protein LOC132197849 n=1 Tax=Neocloeon triangulifer TaxID=2078957 RepID=UPI00286F2838|nr:uncharacterized protein LOC132197849 [Neocloeon triangulifer]
MENTEGQHSSGLFRRARANRLTASNFGKIFKLDAATHPHNTVRRLRNPTDLSNNAAVKYGLHGEDLVKQKFKTQTGLAVRKIGLCVNKNWPYLGASPDGAVGANAIIEIKCLYSAKERKIFDFVAERQGVDERGEQIMENGKKKKKDKFSSVCLEIFEGKLRLKRKHDYFFQIQGQLAISEKEKCYFVASTDVDLFVEEILPDKELWANMERKLSEFYLDYLLPEIVDPRIIRGLTVRVPPQYAEAAAKREQQKTEKRKPRERE